MITTGLLILFAATVAVSAVIGLIRGLNKSVIRMISLVLAAVLTFVIAGPVTKLVAQSIKIDGLTLGEMLLESLLGMETVGEIIQAAPLMQEAVLTMPAFFIAIPVFPVVFCLLSFVSWIVFLFVQKPLRRLIFREGRKETEEKPAPSKGVRIGKRFAGMGIGVVAGVLTFAMLVAPLLGLFSILPDADAMNKTMDALVEQEMLTNADAETVEELYAVTDSGLVKAYSAVGVSAAGRAYLNSVSRIEAEGEKTCLGDEVDALLAVVQTAVEGGLVEALMNPEDEDALYVVLANPVFVNDLMQDMFQSRLLRSAAPELMSIAMKSVAQSMNVPTKEVIYSSMMDSVALAVRNADIDYAGIEAYEKAHGITQTVIRLSAVSTGAESELMTEEEYQAEVQKLGKLAQTISAIVNMAVAGDNEAFADSVAEQLVMEIKTQAAADGQALIENFDAAGVQKVLENLAADEEGTAQLLEQLKDPEKFETDMPTAETIAEAIRQSVQDALGDDDKAAETANALANIVSGLIGAVSGAADENGNFNIADVDFDKLADAVTELQNSPLKDVGSSILDIIGSADLGDSSMMSDVVGAVKEGYENGEDIGGTIKTFGALISLGDALSGGDDNETESEGGAEAGGSAGGGISGVVGGETGNQSGGVSGEKQEAVVNSLVSLIENLNEFTISLLPSVLSEETIASLGVPAEYAGATYDVIETLLKELMKLKGAEDYDNEVNAILSLYDLATSGVENFTEEDVDELVHYAVESDAIFNTLTSVAAANPFGIEIPDEETRTELANAIEEHYAQSGRSQRERDIYNAVATLLGLDAEVDLAA